MAASNTVASKTVGEFYWLFLYFVACVPTALFGGIMTSSYVYNHDHYHGITNYMQVLHTWELVAAAACAVPGFVWVGACQLRDHRKDQAKLRLKEIERRTDDTVWPPAPRL